MHIKVREKQAHIFVAKLEVKSQLGDLKEDERMILKLILDK
jgi:hypothetical protein